MAPAKDSADPGLRVIATVLEQCGMGSPLFTPHNPQQL
jgi:hypothetical protein